MIKSLKGFKQINRAIIITKICTDDYKDLVTSPKTISVDLSIKFIQSLMNDIKFVVYRN